MRLKPTVNLCWKKMSRINNDERYLAIGMLRSGIAIMTVAKMFRVSCHYLSISTPLRDHRSLTDPDHVLHK